MTLSYIVPQFVHGNVVIQLENEDVDRETEKWKGALIAYVIGDCPGYNAIRRYIDVKWKKIADPDLFIHEEGYFIIKFKSIDDMPEILCTGPYIINNRPIILKPWTTDFDFDKEFPTEISIWIKLPILPMNCWGINSLSRIASAIGIQMYADECTAKQMRVSYARILVEVHVTKPLPDHVEVKDPSGRVFQHVVSYDWKPMFCE
ncbi:uncharacterized protein LOC142176099 [Nicotiana tabacum]|uniref:Uncharacterized protein LOC142176099 n=2 Tax=Nicotiana TaxID=4085 RepID=A0AC58TPZ0_TOBAC|nr:PREDICTED: uncharacterized protein LOC104246396 [Nicotiana sylvestris]